MSRDEEISEAQTRAVLTCRHDICACGHLTPAGEVVGDPLGEIGHTEYVDVLGMSWDQTTWNKLDTPRETR